jgi:5-methylcytosine-specific restriction endonuclease McrA
VLKKIAKDTVQDVSRAKEIGLMLCEQHFKCAYTNIPLQIGINASLDHIVPRSKGGSNDRSNLQWIDIGINRLKLDKSDIEFRSLLKQLSVLLPTCPAVVPV